ncbi:hypothetical protein BD779DRAFT_1454508 [Infundibulicybe gibba]|nr:hypothetical protein BD779DRAFT_1454508 [Infundibulicybe gibba]
MHGKPWGTEVLHSFRQVSAFGRSTIRKFPYNVADLPGLAARDYEDILQCCIPCFEGLLPDPHNNTLLDLLYILNYWHSMAKLRMHTDTSLRVFRQLTTNLGAALRYFADETCQHFQTFETDKEYQARSRAIPLATPEHPPCIPDAVLPASGKRPKKFNISTPKAHFFPDYADQIGRFGTTDSLSTKVVRFSSKFRDLYLTLVFRVKVDTPASKTTTIGQISTTQHRKLSILMFGMLFTFA